MNSFLTTVLGPLAEDIFFFGVLNITLISYLRKISVDRTKGLVVAGLLLASSFMFTNVPNHFILAVLAAGIMAATTLFQNKFLVRYGPLLASALFIGGLVFPMFHSYAYNLQESNYVAASWFGIIVCILAGLFSIIPVDILHIFNNIVASMG